MNLTCAGCGVTEDLDLMRWVRDRDGYFWHLMCRWQDVAQRLDDLTKRPIKEHHDGHGSRPKR